MTTSKPIHPERAKMGQRRVNKANGMLPIVSNNSITNYKMAPNQVYSMITSLNNSGILLEPSVTQDNNSISVHHKPSNSVGEVPVKGKQFSGHNTAMINYIKDLDYVMDPEGSANGLHGNSETIHNYSVNYANSSKLGKKKSLLLTSQKNTKRRSVERESSIRSKHKRSASDGHRIMSSKGRKKESAKSPPISSAYYNKMLATFSNPGKFHDKSLRKGMNKAKNVYNPNVSMLSKKGGKEYNSKKKIKSYYESNYNSKTKDDRQKSSNIRSVPISLLNSFEKKQTDKSLKKRLKNSQIQNYQKVPNQMFYQKGKVNVSGQHLKFGKPKSKSNMSHHSENTGHNFSKSLAFSGDTSPISPPFQQDSGKNSMRISKKKNSKKVYQMVPSPFPNSNGSGMSYENAGYPTYYQSVGFPRPETNVNVYDEDASILSGHDNSKNHSFYQGISGSFVSQTYENSRKKGVKRDTLQGYSYHSGDTGKAKMIMDKKTKMSKISELMGHKEVIKKSTKKDKKHAKSYHGKFSCYF